MTIRKRLEEELTISLKAGKREETSVIRLTLSELKNAEKDRRRPLEDDEQVRIVRSAIKKRREAIALFKKGGRMDLVEKESAEIRVLERYLPAPLSEEELTALVAEGLKETGASTVRDLGKAMKWIMPRLEGRAEGTRVSAMVRERLGQGAPSPDESPR